MTVDLWQLYSLDDISTMDIVFNVKEASFIAAIYQSEKSDVTKLCTGISFAHIQN